MAGGDFGSGPSNVSGGGVVTRRGRDDWAAALTATRSRTVTVNNPRRIFLFLMGVILSDIHDSFQTAAGRETRDGTSDAAALSRVCLSGRERDRKAVSASPQR